MHLHTTIINVSTFHSLTVFRKGTTAVTGRFLTVALTSFSSDACKTSSNILLSPLCTDCITNILRLSAVGNNLYKQVQYNTCIFNSISMSFTAENII